MNLFIDKLKKPKVCRRFVAEISKLPSINMTHQQILEEEPKINNSELDRIEKLYGLTLPKDYREFLLLYNGAVFYKNYPTISNGKNYELYGVERFLSIGDLILQKKYPLYYTFYDDQSEDGELNKLNQRNHLIFALTDRGGMYFFDLSNEDYGQIYFADNCGTMVKINTNSFSTFINSFDFYPEHRGTNNQDSIFKLHYSSHKIFQSDLFFTPNQPELGLERFKDVFQVNNDFQPTENGYPNVPQKYVNDKLKLDYLLSVGCKTDGLLNYAKSAQIVKYLVHDIGLNINEPYKGRYPLQNFLTAGSGYDCNVKYKLMDELLEMRIEMDWDIKGILWEGEPDLPFIVKLQKLNDEYYKNEEWEKSWRRNDFVPFKRSKNIENKLNGR